MRAAAVAAAAAGFLGVAIGAFGAHGITDPRAAALIDTGAQYQLIHALAVFAALALRGAGAEAARFAPWFFLAGVALFAGALYALALGAPSWVGAIAPIGGLSFLAGWATLAVAGLSLARRARAPE